MSEYEDLNFTPATRGYYQTTTKSIVSEKMGLLDLPPSVQIKIIKGDIPVSKARRLVTLTRGVAYSTADGIGLTGVPQKTVTEVYYPQIELIVKEIEKGTEGGLRTSEGIGQVIALMKAGDTVDNSIKLAKIQEAIDLAKKRAFTLLRQSQSTALRQTFHPL